MKKKQINLSKKLLLQKEQISTLGVTGGGDNTLWLRCDGNTDSYQCAPGSVNECTHVASWRVPAACQPPASAGFVNCPPTLIFDPSKISCKGGVGCPGL